MFCPLVSQQMKFSSKVSKQPRKQRKALYASPLHAMRKMLHAHLSRELRSSLGRRSVLAAKGDGVKVIRGRFKGASGKIVQVNLKRSTVSVERLMAKKQSGKEVPAVLRPNQFVITEIAPKRKIKPGGRKPQAQAAKKTLSPAPADAQQAVAPKAEIAVKA